MCPNVFCCESKSIDGCWKCDKVNDCNIGFFSSSENDAKAHALYIKKYGTEKYTNTILKLINDGYDYPREFKDINEPLVLICIDENKLTSEIKYEDNDNCGRYYPHIYGEINVDSIVQVLPFLRDDKGNYIKNPEFDDIEEK